MGRKNGREGKRSQGRGLGEDVEEGRERREWGGEKVEEARGEKGKRGGTREKEGGERPTRGEEERGVIPDTRFDPAG